MIILIISVILVIVLCIAHEKIKEANVKIEKYEVELKQEEDAT